jgi:hypothetical protein
MDSFSLLRQEACSMSLINLPLFLNKIMLTAYVLRINHYMKYNVE